MMIDDPRSLERKLEWLAARNASTSEEFSILSDDELDRAIAMLTAQKNESDGAK